MRTHENIPIKDSRRTAALVGALLVVVAGVGILALGGIAADNPSAVSDSSTDASTNSSSEDTADDEENSSTPLPTTAESNPEPSDGEVEDNHSEDNEAGDNHSEDNEAGDNHSEDAQQEDRSGVNFVPGVRDFTVSTEVYDESSSDVEDGFVSPGEHRLLRFDMIVYNVGDSDAELGRPENRPDLFDYSESHDHEHLKRFNKYTLLDDSGEETGAVRKQTFCLRDLNQTRSTASGSPQFDCEYQGISAGWADEYDASLPGQYIIIDDLPDGAYTLEATTNAAGAIDEVCDSDNTVRVDLTIHGDTVSVDTPRRHYVKPSAC